MRHWMIELFGKGRSTMKWPVMSAMVMAIAATAAPASATSFCGRMAQQMKLKPASDAPPGTAWQINRLGGFGTFMFGGSANFTMAVAPGEHQHTSAVAPTGCASDARVVACTVAGPALLKITINGSEFAFPAEPGETARVSIIKARVRCENTAPRSAGPM